MRNRRRLTLKDVLDFKFGKSNLGAFRWTADSGQKDTGQKYFERKESGQKFGKTLRDERCAHTSWWALDWIHLDIFWYILLLRELVEFSLVEVLLWNVRSKSTGDLQWFCSFIKLIEDHFSGPKTLWFWQPAGGKFRLGGYNGRILSTGHRSPDFGKSLQKVRWTLWKANFLFSY